MFLVGICYGFAHFFCVPPTADEQPVFRKGEGRDSHSELKAPRDTVAPCWPRICGGYAPVPIQSWHLTTLCEQLCLVTMHTRRVSVHL